MHTKKKVAPTIGDDRKYSAINITNIENNINNFIELMESEGLSPPQNLTPGKIHRFPGKGKRANNKAGWCRLFDDTEAGVYGDWSDEEEATKHWRSPTKPRRKISHDEINSAKVALKKELDLEQDMARNQALKIISESQPVYSHTYLTKKGVKAHGLLRYKNELAIPLSDQSGNVNTIQFISEAGRKRFLTGGKVEGFFTIGSASEADVICITEGYATGASVYEATNYRTIVCFGKNNLSNTARSIRDLYPTSKIIICADNDWSTPGNPGKKTAENAAKKINGFIALPDFGPRHNNVELTDFNDLSITLGKDKVIECIKSPYAPQNFNLNEPSIHLISFLAKTKKTDIEEIPSSIDLNTDIVEQIYKNCIWNPLQKKFYLIAPAGDLKIFSKDEFSNLIDSVFDDVCDYGKLNDKFELDHKDLFLNLKNLIIAHRQATNFSMQIDIFAQSGSVLYSIKDASARFIYTHQPFIEKPIDLGIINDYKEHFPQFDEVLKFIAASRFASDRKQCYLWINAESDWGKNFFLDALKSHGLVVETSMTEIEKLFSGGPVGKSITEFKKSWILAIDEFKGVKSELKQLKDEMPVSPKNQSTTWVPIYLKLFLSAEHVASLASPEIGIEDQFANRFTLMSGKGQLNKRQLFINGKTKYFESIKNYVASYLNKEVVEYIKLGREDAFGRAENEICTFYNKFRIDNFYSRLSGTLPELASEFCSWAITIYLDANADNTQNEKGVAKFVREKHGNYYLKNIAKLFDIWLESNFSRSETQKIGYKRTAIIQLIGKPTSSRINDAVEKLTLVPNELLIGRINLPDF